MLTNDGEMAKKGYYAGDVAVVSNRFADRYPALVEAWMEQNLRAVDWVDANGPGAYAAMMKEYELTPEQLRAGALPPATTFPGKAEQMSNQWLGDGGKEGLVESAFRIGQFLQQNKLIAQAPSREQLVHQRF